MNLLLGLGLYLATASVASILWVAGAYTRTVINQRAATPHD